MTALLNVALQILLIDIANPVRFATTILALITARPVASALAVIPGHRLTYFAAGALVLFGLAELLVFSTVRHPENIDYDFSLLVGLALLWVALRWRIAPPPLSDTPPDPPRTRLSAALDRVAAYIMPVMLGLPGLFLLAGATASFATGTGLI